MISVQEISGYTMTAVNRCGRWYPAKIDLGTGNTVELMFGFDQEDDAIEYAMDNFEQRKLR